MSALSELFSNANRPVPPRLVDWEDHVAEWCDEYEASFPQAAISEMNLDLGVFLFDLSADRVVLAYALSIEQKQKRDATRMKGFPNPNVSVRKVVGDHAFFVCKEGMVVGDHAFFADKGHFLGHASGGILDINLFPQRRELNRGWSEAGKRFRAMERHVAEHPGTFFYHRAMYDDETWIPDQLEYGVLREDDEWWIEKFANK